MYVLCLNFTYNKGGPGKKNVGLAPKYWGGPGPPWPPLSAPPGCEMNNVFDKAKMESTVF